MARRSSPGTLIARARIAEAAGRRTQAGVFPRENPVVDLEVGPRLVADDPRSIVVAVGISQSFDLGGGVSARLRRVDAEMAQAAAEADGESTRALSIAAASFARAVWAEERLRLARDASAITRAFFEATKKRIAAGDATALELNLAKGGAARALADEKAQEASREQALGELAVVLGLAPGEAIVVRGDLGSLSVATPGALAKSVAEHPELRALRAERDAANADIEIADAMGYPTLGVGARYENEDDNIHTVLGTLSLTLPIFERGQGLEAEAKARASRASIELREKERTRSSEVEALSRVAKGRREAARAFEAEGGVESFKENLRLATKGFEAGETSVGEMLVVRRELIDTEANRIDRLLEAKLAEIELARAAGALR